MILILKCKSSLDWKCINSGFLMFCAPGICLKACANVREVSFFFRSKLLDSDGVAECKDSEVILTPQVLTAEYRISTV